MKQRECNLFFFFTLKEAEAIFNAFDKMPNELWEDEHDKYFMILEKYKEIKMKRWSETKV